MELFKKINIRQPKYMLPLILYFPLLIAGYLIFDIFDTEVAEVPDANMQTTEYLNPELPDAQMKGDGIGGKYESMLKSYGRIDDLSAVDNIDRYQEDETPWIAWGWVQHRPGLHTQYRLHGADAPPCQACPICGRSGHHNEPAP